MRLATYRPDVCLAARLGALVGQYVVDLGQLATHVQLLLIARESSAITGQAIAVAGGEVMSG